MVVWMFFGYSCVLFVYELFLELLLELFQSDCQFGFWVSSVRPGV